MERGPEAIILEDGDFAGLTVSIEDPPRFEWHQSLADFLDRRPRVDCLGLSALIVIAVAVRYVKHPAALVVVAMIAAGLAAFVILIGRPDVNEASASFKDDAGPPAEGPGQAGEDQ